MTVATSPAPTAPVRVAVPARAGVARRRVLGGFAAVVVVVGHVLAWRATEFSPQGLIDGWRGIVRFLDEAVPPDLAWTEVLRPSLDAALVTFWIGLLGTTLSIPAALLLAVLAARNTSPGAVAYQFTRAVLSFLRAVPDVVFALVFVTAVGLGPFAGVLALVCHNAGVMGKLWAESMESVERGPVEALRTTGATGPQVVVHAVLPAVVPQFVGLLLYRLDVNVRSSLVLGLVGAGGIGFLINRSIKLFRFDEMLTHILVVLVMIVLVDQISAAIRRRLTV